MEPKYSAHCSTFGYTYSTSTVTIVLMSPQLVLFNMGKWTILYPNLLKSRRKKIHNMIERVKTVQVTNVTREGKRYYSRSIEDTGTIKITGGIFPIESFLKLI